MAKRRSFSASDVRRALLVVKKCGFRIEQIEITLTGSVLIRIRPDSVFSGSEVEMSRAAQSDGKASGEAISEADLDNELAGWKARHGH